MMASNVNSIVRMAKKTSKLRDLGWGIGLYRERSDAWLGGVCSGVAAKLDLPNWVVRGMAVTFMVFSTALAIYLYLLIWITLAPSTSRLSRLEFEKNHENSDLTQNLQVSSLKLFFHAADPPTSQLLRSRRALSEVTQRVDLIEVYVASIKYEQNQR